MNDSLFQELIQALREKKIAHEWKWIVEYAQKKFPGDNQKQQYLIEKIVCRRLKEEPLAYIFGEWSFLNWEFSLDRGVLIPRPETEELVLLAFEEIKLSLIHI